MEDLLLQIFGHGKDLHPLQAAARGVVIFFITVILIRISGMRSFGSKSAFDNIVVIMLGAVLSRAVVGVSPFLPTLAAAITICVIHRIVAMLCTRFHVFSDLMKGTALDLYKNGQLNKGNLRKCDLSMGDLEEGIRLTANISSIDEAEEIRMERSGHISVVKK